MEGQKFETFIRTFYVSRSSAPILLVEQLISSSSEDMVFKTTSTEKEHYLLLLKGRRRGSKPLDNAVVFDFQHFEKSVHTGISVGRATTNKICLPDNAISKMHASFKLTREGQWQVMDIESENKTRLNGKYIASKKPVVLQDGDGITFADTYHCTFFLPQGFKAYLDSLPAK